MKEFHRQCRFKSEDGKRETIALIPESGAKLGYSMTFPDTGLPDRWVVIEVSSVRIAKDEIKRSDVFGSIKQ